MVAAIMLLTIQPGYGSGGTGQDSGGGCGSGSGSGTGSVPPSSSRVAQEAYSDYSDATVTMNAASFAETLNGDTYVGQLLGDASNRLDPRLPGYSYFQGLIQANNHITVAGQVRVIGGILGADRSEATTSLYNGAMITTNAHAFVGAGDALVDGPPGMRTRIRHMEEIPPP
jgi:hypothetical protein